MSNVKSAQAWAGLFVTRDGNGALSAATTGPVGALYVNGASNAASVTITGSNPYKWSVTLPSLTAGDTVSMYITAKVAGVATASVVAEAIGDTSRTSDVLTPATLARKILQNRTETNPATGIMTVYDDDGTTPLYTANIYADIAGATAYDGTAGVNRRNALA